MDGLREVVESVTSVALEVDGEGWTVVATRDVRNGFEINGLFDREAFTSHESAALNAPADSPLRYHDRWHGFIMGRTW